MKFFKYHGTGNDFILVDNRKKRINGRVEDRLAIRLCDRHFGIGGDGLIFMESSNEGDAKMRIFNPDGTEAEMCGNGIRCVGRYLYDAGMKKEVLLIETASGMKEVKLTVEEDAVTYLTVDMGLALDVALNKRLETEEGLFEYCYVNTGVPHAVLFVDTVEAVPVERIAPAIRYNPLFPQGANVNFVERVGGTGFKIRTYERGVEEETLACGTGITASGASAVLLGYVKDGMEMEFQSRGGTVYVVLKKEDNGSRMFMKGPAEFVFKGEISREF